MHCTALHCTAQHYSALHCSALDYLHCTALRCSGYIGSRGLVIIFCFVEASHKLLKYFCVQCSAVKCIAVQYSVVQCSTVQCSAVQCSIVCSAVQDTCPVQCRTGSMSFSIHSLAEAQSGCSSQGENISCRTENWVVRAETGGEQTDRGSENWQ